MSLKSLAGGRGKRHIVLSSGSGNVFESNRIPEVQFWLLIEVSSFYSEKIIKAMRDYLVSGHSRREVCERYNVNPGNFSTSLRRLHELDVLVSQLAPFYTSLEDKK